MFHYYCARTSQLAGHNRRLEFRSVHLECTEQVSIALGHVAERRYVET